MKKKTEVNFSETQIAAFTVGREQLLFLTAIDALPEFTGISYWEDLSCVGYNPKNSELNAIVSIKRATGYSGGLCTRGSGEYVRFYVDWKDGLGFQDVGFTSFRSHDISDAPPGRQHPLQYMVSLPLEVQGKQRCCGTPVLPTVRAILSWNAIPPPATPGHIPTYGDVEDVDIQINPRFLYFGELFDLMQVKPKSELLDLFDLKALVPQFEPQVSPVTPEILKQNRALKIPDHRTLAPIIAPLMASNPSVSGMDFKIDKSLIDLAQIDVSAILEAFVKTKADTTFEELVCAGLQTANDKLGAVIHIKKEAGYGGDLCRRGTIQYVAFWVDWDNAGAAGYQYMGTAGVEVHNIAPIPDDGLYYSVTLPIDVTKYLRSCKNPNVVKVRAVLSWNTPPSTTDSLDLTTFGNRLDRLAQIRPGETIGTDLVHRFDFIGNVPVTEIDPATHLAFPNPLANLSNNRPWGGQVNLRAKLFNTGAPYNAHFQVQYYEPLVSNWLPVNNQHTFTTVRPLGAGTVFTNIFIDSSVYGGWFPYVANPGAYEDIVNDVLAVWNTAGRSGAYRVRLAYTTDHSHNTANISYSEEYVIQLNNVYFNVNPGYGAAVNPAFTVDMVIDGGDCHTYAKKEIIQGHLRAIDQYFGRWELDVQPTSHITGPVVYTPAGGVRNVISALDNGDTNAAWTLDTSNIDPCGYTARVRAYKRTIFDSATSNFHHVDKYVGFSIV